MNRIARRTATMLIAAPALAAALFAGAAPAFAAPGESTTCTDMAMPQTSAAGIGAPGMMTRAGQVGMQTPAPDSSATMGSGCSAVGH